MLQYDKKNVSNVVYVSKGGGGTIWTFDEKNPHPEKVFPKERRDSDWTDRCYLTSVVTSELKFLL